MVAKLDPLLFSEIFPETNNGKRKTNIGHQPEVVLTWSDLSVTVRQEKKRFFGKNTVTYKKLVNNVSGAIESGKLIALMGPSGAGKSTILYALANRLSDEIMVNGDIRINGKTVDKSMCKISGLMRQEDIFIGDLTVKEHLLFMACLKLDRRLSAKDREKRVIFLLKELGLSHCTNRKIGGSMFGEKAVLSGGERKRLSFATACLPNPPLLFCDEPTTGLDSLNAIRLVSMMSSWNGAILCTIHQPSPEMLKYFSSIMLVANGSLVFSGSVNDANEFFKSAGYHMNEYEGAGEFLLSCIAPPPGSEMSDKMNVKQLAHRYAISEYAKPTEILIKLQGQPFKTNAALEALWDHKPANWFFKFYCLFYRSMLELIRNPSLQWLKIGQKIIMGLVIGLCYIGAVNNDQAGIQAVQGVVFVLVTENTFPALYSALAQIPRELPLLVRELRDGDYHPSALYLAKILSHIPGLALDAFIFTVIIYGFANLRSTVFAFFMTSLVTILCILVSTACGLMFANIFVDYELANIFLIPFDNTMMITSGLFVKLSTLPDTISWIQHVSWMRYSFESITILQWGGSENISCSQTTYLPCLQSGTEIMEYYSFAEENLNWNITCLILLFAILNIVGYIFFVKKIRTHW